MMFDVSVIIPMWNASAWIDDCLESVFMQQFSGSLQVVIYNDNSTDDCASLALNWQSRMISRKIDFVLINGVDRQKPGGAGYARNSAIRNSSGRFLCFLDADDIMHPDRVQSQYDVAKVNQDAIVGCRFSRVPEGSTVRYTNWANRLTQEQLYHQAFTSHGPTIITPTWFCSRAVFDAVGKFDETANGVPEDTIFFLDHLELGGKLICIPEVLLTYRYHLSSVTFTVPEEENWKLRVDALQRRVLSKWNSFTIWNAGKQGRHLYRSLSDENRTKVVSFCDVDSKKIAKGFYVYEDSKLRPKPSVPVVHFRDALPPFIICVKMDLTNGSFENNLESLNLTEGKDYFHFN